MALGLLGLFFPWLKMDFKREIFVYCVRRNDVYTDFSTKSSIFFWRSFGLYLRSVDSISKINKFQTWSRYGKKNHENRFNSQSVSSRPQIKPIYLFRCSLSVFTVHTSCLFSVYHKAMLRELKLIFLPIYSKHLQAFLSVVDENEYLNKH